MSESKTNYSTPEPPPKSNNNPSIHDLVIADVKDRKQFGLEKYGKPLQAGNGRRSLVDAYQEILDLAVYLRQHIEESITLPEPVKEYDYRKGLAHKVEELDGWDIELPEDKKDWHPSNIL